MYIVSGGYTGSALLSSVEIWTRGSSIWFLAADLPSRRYGLRGVTIGAQFFLTGEQAQLLQYNEVLNVVYVVYVQGASTGQTFSLMC